MAKMLEFVVGPTPSMGGTFKSKIWEVGTGFALKTCQKMIYADHDPRQYCINGAVDLHFRACMAPFHSCAIS